MELRLCVSPYLTEEGWVGNTPRSLGDQIRDMDAFFEQFRVSLPPLITLWFPRHDDIYTYFIGHAFTNMAPVPVSMAPASYADAYARDHDMRPGDVEKYIYTWHNHMKTGDVKKWLETVQNIKLQEERGNKTGTDVKQRYHAVAHGTIMKKAYARIQNHSLGVFESFKDNPGTNGNSWSIVDGKLVKGYQKSKIPGPLCNRDALHKKKVLAAIPATPPVTTDELMSRPVRQELRRIP